MVELGAVTLAKSTRLANWEVNADGVSRGCFPVGRARSHSVTDFKTIAPFYYVVSL
jgi:hypothetical protein